MHDILVDIRQDQSSNIFTVRITSRELIDTLLKEPFKKFPVNSLPAFYKGQTLCHNPCVIAKQISLAIGAKQACVVAAYSAADALSLLQEIAVEGVFTIATAEKELVSAFLHTGDCFSTFMDTDAMPSTDTGSPSAPVVNSSFLPVTPSIKPEALLLHLASGGGDSTSTLGNALSQDTTTPLGDDGDLLANETLEDLDEDVDIVGDV